MQNQQLTRETSLKFADDFLLIEREIPDLILHSLLSSRSRSSTPTEKRIIDDLIACYALGHLRPALSLFEGLKWYVAEKC